LTVIGHALARLVRLEEAVDAYRQAVDIRRALGEQHLVADVLAGLIEVALQQADPVTAHSYAGEVLAQAEATHLEGAVEPLRIYTACYQALRVSDHSRASEVLAAARLWLDEQAARIGNATQRETFLAAYSERRRELERASVLGPSEQDD
jgi:hypothetical protein